MKAYVVARHGDLDVLELSERPEPQPAPGHVIVEVKAVALNHLDVWVRRGVPGHNFPLPLIPGCEVSGVIAQSDDPRWPVGSDVLVAPGWSCGECAACSNSRDPLCRDYHIIGESRDGGLCERLLVPVRYLFARPPHLSFAETAALPLDLLTAWHMLVDRAAVRPGESVLVQAGASGVGSAAIQIAGLWGASEIIATVGSAEKGELARALGATSTILYREVDFAREVRSLTARRGVDVVIEHVGADTFDGSVRSLARGGRLVTCGATTGGDVTLNLRLLFFKGLSILGSTMGSLGELHEIMGHVARGRLRPVVGRVLPFSELAEGHRLLEERAVVGKVVIEL